MSTVAFHTLYNKIGDVHAITAVGGGEILLYVDCHLLHEVTSPQAFDRLPAAGGEVRWPDLMFAVANDNVTAENRAGGLALISDPDSRLQIPTLENAVHDFAIPYATLTGARHGIVHVVGPELGLTLPGAVMWRRRMKIWCVGSHSGWPNGGCGTFRFAGQREIIKETLLCPTE